MRGSRIAVNRHFGCRFEGDVGDHAGVSSVLVGTFDEGERCGLTSAFSHRSDVRIGFVGENVVLVVLHRVPGRNEAGREGRVGIVDLDRVLLGLPRLVNDRHIEDEPAVVAGITATLWPDAGGGLPLFAAGSVEDLPVFVEIVGGVRKGCDCSDYMFLGTVVDGRSGPGLVPIAPHVAVDVRGDLRVRIIHTVGRVRTALRNISLFRIRRILAVCGLPPDRPGGVFGHRDIDRLEQLNRVVELLFDNAVDGAGDNEVDAHRRIQVVQGDRHCMRGRPVL